MANSKAYVFFVILFTLLLSPHVLTHMLPEVVSYPNFWPPRIPPDENDGYKELSYLEFQRTFSPIESFDMKDNDKTHYRRNDFQVANPSAIHSSNMTDNAKNDSQIDSTTTSYDRVYAFQPAPYPPDAGPAPPAPYPPHLESLQQPHKFQRVVAGHPDAESNYYEDGNETLKRKNYEDGTTGTLNKTNYENEIVLTHRKMMKPSEIGGINNKMGEMEEVDEHIMN